MKRCVRSERVYECVRARYHVLMRIMVIMISRVSVAGGDSAPRPLYIVPLVGTLNWCSSACTDRLQNYYRMFIHRYTHTEISEHRPTAIKATHIELCSSCGRRRLILHLIQNCNKWFYYRNDLQSQTSVVQRYIYIWNFQRESSNEWPSALRHRRIVVSNYLCAMQYVDACQRGSECAVVVMQ